MRILAIDPGIRELGLAVLDDGVLLYHGVKIIPKGRSPQQTLHRATTVVNILLEDFRPDVLVIEKTFIGRNRNVALLNVLEDEIRSIARRQGLPLFRFAPNVVKKAICGHGWATKADVAKAVVARYPELRAYMVHDRKWRERFHANMFDAVALGLMVC